MVVGSDGEADSVVSDLAETSLNRLLSVAVLLIDAWSLEAHVALVCREKQVTGIDVGGSAFEAQRNPARLSARRNPEVVFELSLIDVIYQVDARVNCLILHAAKLRNVMTPLGRIVPNEVIALPGQRRSARNARRRVRSVEPHPNHGSGRRLRAGSRMLSADG